MSERKPGTVLLAASRRRATKSGLLLLAGVAAPWAVGPAHAQGLFDKLLEAARERMSKGVPGLGGVPGIGEPVGVASPRYVATVLHQILVKADQSQVSNPHNTGQRIGNVTLSIDISSGGRLLEVKVTGTSGQGSALTGKAIESVRRAAPFPVPVMADGGAPKRVIIEETWVFNRVQRWTLESAIDTAKELEQMSG
ncbi:energy transducer TonB [Burkholderiaceae bacterium FT117]|uniref:energy transducer TonB n=1 Tax=Zeimonas sediminis TaxID=2944268 RepID=UPI002342F9ED|nr:energy transducer TonB [Zeimonas sediminis]MCM5569627.1 energy transducer TonB [Zeimonas sediminis]